MSNDLKVIPDEATLIELSSSVRHFRCCRDWDMTLCGLHKPSKGEKRFSQGDTGCEVCNITKSDIIYSKEHTCPVDKTLCRKYTPDFDEEAYLRGD